MSCKPVLELLENRTLLSAGSLDSTFGTAGEVTTDFGGVDFAAKVLVQGDGKIVAVGTSRVAAVNSFALARYDADGSLDTTFGIMGKVTSPLGSASGAAFDANGNILVAGQDSNNEFVVARYTAAGILDSTFGTAGVVTTSIQNASGASVAVQADAKIVVAGYSAGMPAMSFSTIELVRYNADGSLDATFGKSGIANGGSGKITNNVVIEPDHKILVAGEDERTMTVSDTHVFVKRFNADGSADMSFPEPVDLGTGTNFAYDLALRGDGKILVTASANGSGVLVRMNADGSADPSFGVNGQVSTDFPGRLAVQPNRQILVAGRNGFAFEVSRYNEDGSLDTRFAAAGIASATFANPVTAPDVALQSDGKIIVAGGVQPSNSSGDFALARLVGGPAAPLSGKPNQRFVEQIYLDLLRRAAEPSGLAYWTGKLDKGTASRTQIALGVEGSPEYHALVVKDLYAALLHRDADTAALATWTSFLGSGGTRAQLFARLAGSDEYQTLNGNTTSGFVDGLYRDVLHRYADSGEQGWIQAINHGMSPANAAAAILASRESDQDEVRAFYHLLLNRSADLTGLNEFVNLMQQGSSSESIMATIIGSQEYFARAQT